MSMCVCHCASVSVCVCRASVSVCVSFAWLVARGLHRPIKERWCFGRSCDVYVVWGTGRDVCGG